MNSHIFVCYSRVDHAITVQLAHLLRKAYDHVWYDENLHGGEEWWAEILREIAACQHFILIMSDDSIESEWCQRELDEASRLQKHIVPVLVRARTRVPEPLGKIQRIDMSSGISAESLNQLYATMIRRSLGDGIPEKRQKQWNNDRKLLDRLWLFINGRYIEVLNEQIQHGSIDWEQYTSHVTKYLDMRAKARDHFGEVALEEAFEAFDDALIRLDGQIGWTYELNETSGRAFMSQPQKARDDSYWFEKYNRLVRRAADVWMRHIELVGAIRAVLPDFDVMKEY